MRSVLALWCLAGALACAQDPPPAAPAADTEALIKALGSDDFKERSSATERLRNLGEAARSSLMKAKDSGNAEQKTRVQALLQELDDARAEAGNGGFRGQRLEPVRPDLPPGAGAPGIPGFSPMPRLEDFPDPAAWMEAIRRHIESQQGNMLRGLQGPIHLAPGRNGVFSFALNGPGATMSSTVQTDKERLEWIRRKGRGVTLKVEPLFTESGQPRETATYEADDLESFRTKHPEIYEKYRSLGIFDEQGTDFGFGPGVILPGELPAAPLPVPSGEETGGPRLGVVVAQVPDAVRAHVTLPEKALIIEEVGSGSEAERMGLRRHDILTHVDGVEVGAAEDIRTALAAKAPLPEVLVRIVRKGAPLEVKGARPAVK